MNQIELGLFAGDLSSYKQLLKIAVRHQSICNSAKQSFYLLFFPGSVEAHYEILIDQRKLRGLVCA
jgi:hypothetical protein